MSDIDFSGLDFDRVLADAANVLHDKPAIAGVLRKAQSEIERLTAELKIREEQVLERIGNEAVLRSERDTLKHDLDAQADIANEYLAENERLRAIATEGLKHVLPPSVRQTLLAALDSGKG